MTEKYYFSQMTRAHVFKPIDFRPTGAVSIKNTPMIEIQK